MNLYCAWWLYGAGIPLAPCVYPTFLYQPPIPPGMVWWWPGEAPRRQPNSVEPGGKKESAAPVGPEKAEEAGPGPEPIAGR